MMIGVSVILFLVICWVIGAWASLKLDAILAGEPTSFSADAIIIALISWPIIVACLCTCKHHVNNGCKDYWSI